MNAPEHNLRSVDALRASAMLLGVLLHALIPYLAVAIPHLLWPIHEPAPGTGIDVVYWYIHGFRVPLFFFIGGVFASVSLRRHPPREFLRRRFARIGVPLVMATFTILLLMYLVWSWGWLRSGLAEPRHVLLVRFGHGMQQDLYGFAHLWFLEYLLLYSVILCVWTVWIRRGAGPAAWGFAWWGAVALPTACVLFIDPRPLTEFHNWFLPRTAEFLYHGWFFAVGTAIASERGVPMGFARWWWVCLAASAPSFAWYWTALPAVRGPGASAGELASFAISASLFAWTSIAGWLGLFLRFVRGTGGAVRAIADAAFWVYVAHPPAVGLVQVLLGGVGWPAWVKVSLAFLLATGFCIAAHALVWVPVRARRRRRTRGTPARAAMNRPEQAR